ncbi:MAG TPA: type I secretion C-terminal target domain-containing protein [Coleofasciculaceae cyanobacterium]
MNTVQSFATDAISLANFQDRSWILGTIAGSTQPSISNDGILKLTDAVNDQAGFAVYDKPIATNQGLSISFNFFAYGGTGADGLSVFLLDGSKPSPTAAGAYGGALGYTQRTTGSLLPGLANSYLGIGFDAYGNFSNSTEGRVGGIGFTPDAVALRGSEATRYPYLAGNTIPFSIDNPGTGATRADALRKARIDLTPSGLLSVTVQADLNKDGDFDDLNETVKAIDSFDVVAANGALPATLKLGFAAATGTLTNIHEVQDVQASVNQAPETVDTEVILKANDTVNLAELSATDRDGTIASFKVTTLPAAAQGTLFLNTPTRGKTPVAAGQVLTPDQVKQLVFQANAGFTGDRFTYTAIDNLGAADATPATVKLVQEQGSCKPGITIKGDRRANFMRGTDGSDKMWGQGGDDRLVGQGCRDQLDGGPGNDRLWGGDGNDKLSGGRDRDRLFGDSGNDRLFGGLGADHLHGGQGKDFLKGGKGQDVLQGDQGNDVLRGGWDADQIMGGNNRDAIRGNQGDDRLDGGLGDDTLGGGLGSDRIWGRLGNDRLQGGHGEDWLYGGGGRDRLVGGSQDDVLVGGTGADTLKGGEGRDRFVYRSAKEGRDRIIDFEVSQDIIDLKPILSQSQYQSTDPFARYVKLMQRGANTVVYLDSNGNAPGGFKPLVTLTNVAAATLGANQFAI